MLPFLFLDVKVEESQVPNRLKVPKRAIIACLPFHVLNLPVVSPRGSSYCASQYEEPLYMYY